MIDYIPTDEEQSFLIDLGFIPPFADKAGEDDLCNQGVELLESERFEEAAELFKRSGSFKSMNNLGGLHRRKLIKGHDAAIAIRLLNIAANSGQAIAFLNLAEAHSRGDGVEQNDEKAFEYAKIAADKGYVPAFYSLSMMYWHTKKL